MMHDGQQFLRLQTADLGRVCRGGVLCGLAVMGLTVCAPQDDDRFPPYDNTEEVRAYWEANPEFFRWKTVDDLPPALVWEDGGDVPEFGDPRAKKGGVFHDYQPSFPPTFRFVGPDGNNAFRGQHRDTVEIALVTRHPNEDVWIPGLAREWAVSPDRKTVYFRLHDLVTYSDGVALEVEDFFMTFFVMRSPHLQDPWYNDWYTKEYAGITKFDDRTFAVTLAEAKPDPLWYAPVPATPRHFFREFGADFPARYQWRVCPALGAYAIDPDQVVRGRSITLARVKDWWARDMKHYRYLFNVDAIHYRVVGTPDKAFEMFRQGQLSYFLGGTPRYWYDKSEIPEVYNGYIEKHVFYNTYPQVTWGIYLNQNQPLLESLDVRLGINYALDFKKVLEVDFRGDRERMQSTFAGFGQFTNPELRAKPYDVTKARDHFAKAGFTQMGPDGVLKNAEGKRLSFSLSTFNSGPIVPIMLRLKEGALKAGLEINVEGLDGTQLYKKLDQKKHELCFAGFGAQPPYPRFWEYYHSDNAWKVGEDGKREVVVDTNNITMTADPALDVLIEQARNAKTEEEVKRLSWEIEKIIEDMACAIPAWESPTYRYLSWRWVQWPEGGNAKNSQMPLDAHLFWIDEAVEKETLEARAAGTDLGEVVRVHDRYKPER